MGRMAHVMLNPITVIKNDLELLFLENHNPDTRKRLDRIAKSIDILDLQLANIFEYLISSANNFTEITITQIIKAALSRLEIPSQITITESLCEAKILGDSRKLVIAFANILHNSIEAIGDKSGNIDIKCNIIGDVAQIEITDSANLDELNLDKICEASYTTKQKGMGLGLSVSKDIVQRHFGSIRVLVDPTRFIISLPITK